MQPDDFASRRLQSHYLRWAFERAVAALPDGITLVEHRSRAVAVRAASTISRSGWPTGSGCVPTFSCWPRVSWIGTRRRGNGDCRRPPIGTA
ncbi:MAG: FAD/NAD(P)-binding protein [Nakamurella multipartita]